MYTENNVNGFAQIYKKDRGLTKWQRSRNYLNIQVFQ